MKGCHFNDLKDWAIVVDKLQKLKKTRGLDRFQRVLTRAITYRENWMLRERVLEYVTDIRKPTEALLEAICTIATDDEIYINARILAAEALRVLVPRRVRQTQVCPTFRGVSIWRVLKNIIESPQHPLFHDAVIKALEDIEENRVTRVAS